MNKTLKLFIALVLIFASGALSANAKEKTPQIGYWADDNAGLPYFRYTGALPAVGIEPNGEAAKISDDPWFLLGNYQLTLFTHVSGEYELITGQRAWGRMNQGEKMNSGANGSKISILGIDKSTVKEIHLIGKGSEAHNEHYQKSFGCGFALYKYKTNNLEVERKLSVAPSMTIDGGVPAFLLKVRIKNSGKEAISLNFEESVLANYLPIQFQRQSNRALSFENTYSVDNVKSIVKADVTASSDDPLLIADPDQMSMYDAYPPTLFIKLLTEGVVAYDLNGNLSATTSLTLKRNEERTIEMVIGFTFEGDMVQIEQMATELYAHSKDNSAASSFAAHWLKIIPALENQSDKEIRQELRWHAYNLEAMATYSSFYKETKIPQGTIYDYYWGEHASARDNFQHALPLIYYNPELAKSVMRYMAKRTTNWGEIRLIEYGNGYAENMVYNVSDQQLFFFMLMSEYLRVTKDYAFLDEKVGFFPYGNGGSGSMLDCVKNCFSYLKNNVKTGPHGLVRLLNSDWNDNVFVAKPSPYNWVIYTAESHMNTTMAISILSNLIPSLREYAQRVNSKELQKKAEVIVKSMNKYWDSLYNAFMVDLGDREFSRRMYFNGESIGDDNMFLEPQGYMLQIKELSIERKKALYAQMQKRVYQNEKLGARQQQTPEFTAPGLEDGSRENGGFWYSLNGPAIVGVNTFDSDEAWRLLRNMTFKNYAQQFPQYWTSYWSAADNVESSLMGTEEGLPDQSLDYAAIPVYCAHPHAWILYCYYRLSE